MDAGSFCEPIERRGRVAASLREFGEPAEGGQMVGGTIEYLAIPRVGIVQQVEVTQRRRNFHRGDQITWRDTGRSLEISAGRRMLPLLATCPAPAD